MSRQVTAFQGPCHEGEEWTCCNCLYIQCRLCDGIPSNEDEPLCWQCFNIEDPEDNAA